MTPLLGWPNGASVMLAEDAPRELKTLIGTEAVLTVQGVDVAFAPARELTRTYRLEHCAHRLVYYVPEAHLRLIGDLEARGQRLIYKEQLREMARGIA